MTLAPKTGLGRAGLTSGSAGLGGESLAAGGFAPPPAPTCSITLTSEDAAGFGMSPWPVISGATASIPDSVDTNVYYVATGTLAAPTVVDWTGWRAIQASVPYADWAAGGLIAAAVRAADGYVVSAGYKTGLGYWGVTVSDGTGTPVGDVNLPAFNDPAVRVTFLVNGDTGDIQVLIGGALAADKDTTPTTGSLAAMGGYLAASGVVIGSIATAGADEQSATFTVYPAGADMEPIIAPAGTKDWCGEEDVPQWTPDNLFAGEFGDWIDWRDSDDLYTDVAGTTNVAALNDLIARADGKRGVISLTQSTSGNRGKWAQSLGISSELVNRVVMVGAITERDYPDKLTAVNVSRKANASGGGDTSYFGVKGVSEVRGTHAGNDGDSAQEWAACSRAGGLWSSGVFGSYSIGNCLVAVTQRLAMETGLVTAVRGGALMGSSANLSQGQSTGYATAYMEASRYLTRFAYTTFSLFIERELTRQELLLLSQYGGA